MGAGGVVDVATVVCEAVGDYKVGHAVVHVVAHNLVEGVLCDGDVGCFVLDKGYGCAFCVVYDGIATAV